MTSNRALAKHWRTSDGRLLRVMSVAEGYAMVRFKGAVPFVIAVRDLTSGEARLGRGPFHAVPGPGAEIKSAAI